jgi:flagellar hook assembly protein FlgD
MRPETPPEKLPTVLALGNASPNPFNPSTTIRYDVPKPGGAVTIRVYDVAGRLVHELVNEFRPAGFHEVRWDGIGNRGEPIASGVYFVQMKSGTFAQAKKLVLLK